MLLPILPTDQIDRIFATINDVRTLILHTEGTINQAHNQLALRAVNPTICSTTLDREYTITSDVFKDTVSNHTALQKSLREAPCQAMADILTQVSPALNIPTILSDNTNHTTPTTTMMSAEHAPPTNPTSTIPTETTATQIAEQKYLLQQEIKDLLNKKAIKPVTSGPDFSSTMFVIPKRNSGFCPVFNLKTLNQYLYDAPRFKMEMLQQVIKMIQSNDSLTSIDLADAFLHIIVHHQSRSYLRFIWEAQLPGAKLRDLRRSIHLLLHLLVHTPHQVHSLTMGIKYQGSDHCSLPYPIVHSIITTIQDPE
ncbi:hypothetical protein INT45_001409 [Circinella minor]|uniref:Reverse transcriptase domain-containing protein n=1 Tax=Circinella minor TaxID=1195481 RepID=A0A8H7RPT4_9FUNG|nr:hypothetical protein INT45_001409 [Circinella minor]